MTIISEGGIRPSRIEWVEETVQGEVVSDPAWEMPSERVSDFDPGLTLNWSEDAGLGEVDYSREPTVEEHEANLVYSLQRWLLDGTGNLQDLAAYGLVRASSNTLPSSVSIVRRVSSGDINPQYANAPLVQPASTVNARYNPNATGDGTDSLPRVTRAYDVLKGVDVGEATLAADRGETTWTADLTLPAEHGRSYRIDQMRDPTNLVAFSQDPDDTDYQVHVEDEDNVTSETIPLDGADATTAVASVNSYDNLDVVEYRDPAGNVIDADADSYAGPLVVKTSGTVVSAGWLSVGWGSNDYSNTYSDPGVPALGAGSHAAPISAAGEDPVYYKPQNVEVQRPIGEPIEHAGGVQSMELTTSNNVDRTPSEGREQMLHHGMRGVDAGITADGETLRTYLQSQMMRGDTTTTRLVFNQADDEYIDLESAVVTEAGAGDSAGDLAGGRDYSVLPQSGSDGEPALDVSNAGSGPP